MDGRDFLDLARTLESMPREAAWRSASSRAYYAAFHVARETMAELGFTVPRADRAHAFLWLRLSNCGDALVANAGATLNNMRGDRNAADYELGYVMRRQLATRQIQRAERVIQTLDAARLEPTRTQITDAMKIYERDVLKDVTWQP